MPLFFICNRGTLKRLILSSLIDTVYANIQTISLNIRCRLPIFVLLRSQVLPSNYDVCHILLVCRAVIL